MALATQTYLSAGNLGYLRLLGQTYAVEVRGVSKDTIWVSFPGKSYPVEGAGADLEFHEPSGFTSYHTRVVLGSEDQDGILLQRSEAATKLKNRRSWRVPVEVEVAIEHDGVKVAKPGRLRDVSSDGAQIDAVEDLDIETAVTLRFTLSGVPPITAPAIVIHKRSKVLSRTIHYGVRFRNIGPMDRKSLTTFLYRAIRERYAAELREMYPPRSTPSKPK